MEITTHITQHLIKGEDLNHHGTLYAGRTAEWFVESGFIAAASLANPANIVCKKIHGMEFQRPVHRGEIARFESKIVFTGITRLVAYIQLFAKSELVVKGFITFVHVDENGKSIPHNIDLIASNPEDLKLQNQAALLK
jgi:acyl-CoA hydrolase